MCNFVIQSKKPEVNISRQILSKMINILQCFPTSSLVNSPPLRPNTLNSKQMLPNAVVPKVWCPHQQHQHHLSTCQKCNFLGLTLNQPTTVVPLTLLFQLPLVNCSPKAGDPPDEPSEDQQQPNTTSQCLRHSPNFSSGRHFIFSEKCEYSTTRYFERDHIHMAFIIVCCYNCLFYYWLLLIS